MPVNVLWAVLPRCVYRRDPPTALAATVLALGALAQAGSSAWAAGSEPLNAGITREQVAVVENLLRAKSAPRDGGIRREPRPRLLSDAERRVFDIALDPAYAAPVHRDESEPCDDEAFATRTGDALVEHIRSASRKCIGRLFATAPARFVAFRKRNMIDVAAAAKPFADAYDGTNSSRIVELFLFLRAGFYVAFYEGDELDWTEPDDDIAEAVSRALDAFTDNTHFYDETEEHGGEALDEAVTLMDSAELQARYLGETKSWLRLWRPALAAKPDLRRAVNKFFSLLFRGHWQQAFRDATADDLELVAALREFALGDWMLDTDAEYLAENAGRELARFSQYADAPIHPAVRDGVKAILERYDLDAEGRRIWIAAAAGALFHDDCSVYDICGFDDELEARVLTVRHECDGGTTIRAQDLEPEALAEACALLGAQEQYFHRRLRTGGTPVPDDVNSSLEIVVFADSEEYGTYSTLFFGNDTNNGGIYLEGDPENPGNTARFIAYVATWLDHRPVWNLEHEQVHYLDGRFNMRGSFADYRVDTHHTLWWMEGLAEYISRRNDHPTAVDIGRSRGLKLSEIFPVRYGDGGTKVYRWSYLAVRFLFERHRDEVDVLLGHLRAGEYDAYRRHVLEETGTAYDAEWDAWLLDVPATADATPELVELPSRLSVEEGSSSTYRIALGAAPAADVRVDIAVAGAPVDVAPATLAFSAQNWDAPRTVRVTAPEDDDAAPEAATLLHTAAGGGYDSVRAAVAVAVEDSAPTIAFADAVVSAREGETAVLEVVIDRALESATTFGYRLGPDGDPGTRDADAADHDGADGEATIPAGGTTVEIGIRVLDDAEIEPAREILSVWLVPSTISGFAAERTRAAVVIEEGVCDRTPAVRDALRRDRPCEAVTAPDLADEYFLDLSGRLGGTLRSGDFQGLTGVVDVRLDDNGLETLPDGLFLDMPSLLALYLNGNGLPHLAAGAFDGAGRIGRLWLNRNDLAGLPDGLFRGLGRLSEVDLNTNPGAPFTLTLEWRRLGTHSLAATVREGAPFDMRAEITAVGGTLSMDSVVVPAGALASAPVTVVPDGAGPVRVALDSAPPVPDDDCRGTPCFLGLATARGAAVSIGIDDVAPADFPTPYALPAGVEKRIAIADLFPGRRGETLRYWAGSSDASVVAARVDEGFLVLTPTAVADAVVSVMAAGIDGSATVVHLSVGVVEPAPVSVPYFPSPSDVAGRQGFLRIVEHGGRETALGIEAVDEHGVNLGSLALSVGSGEAVHVDSPDLETGNAAKGLLGGTRAGASPDAWRLVLANAPDIEVLSYVRTRDGLLASMHDLAPVADGVHRVATFNPGSNMDQRSILRLVNPSRQEAVATVRGIDDAGTQGGEVAVRIPARGSLTVSAHELESGAAPGLAGALGDGTGKWRLDIESAQPIEVMSLLASSAGHLANLSSAPSNRSGDAHVVPLLPSASAPSGRSGFVRIVNRSTAEADVTVHAFDDAGERRGPVELTLGPRRATHFSSADLEAGNVRKGLVGSTGSGQGDWRLELTSEADIGVLCYIRARDGSLAAMHDVVPGVANRHRVAIFNPGGNIDQASRLRLINAGGETAEVTIRGIDDAGVSSRGDVRATLAAGTARAFAAAELEAGASNLQGALGKGRGKWRLIVESDRPITVMNLLETPTGHLTNLSTSTGAFRQGSASPP